jgi:2-hydroxychromene-2-carboxylate isomerase
MTSGIDRRRLRLRVAPPVRSAAALRLAVVALDDPRSFDLHRALFRAAWRDQRDLDSRDVLSDCIRKMGGPADEWLLQADSPETAERSSAFAAEAESQGEFGVPSMLLRGELFWGLDSPPTLEW